MKIFTEYKLLNANSKKTFTSEENLLNHITEHKLKPNDMGNIIKYSAVSTVIKEVQVEVAKASKENVIKLLQKMKSHLITKNLEGDPSMYRHLRLQGIKKHPILNKLYITLMERNYPENGFANDEWYSHKNVIMKAICEFIDYLVESYDDLNLNVVKLKTNYKPCNGYGIQFDNYHYLMLRKEDLLFNNSALWGRNVNSKGLSVLTDEDIDKLLS